MKLVFIDSDVLIDALRQVPQALASLKEVSTEAMPAVSVIVRLEVVLGSFNKEALQQTERLLAKLILIHLNESISELANQLVTQFHLGSGLRLADALIAATAIIHDAPLLSKNQRDFRFIPGLKLLPYPAAPVT